MQSTEIPKLRGYTHLSSIELQEIQSHDVIEYRGAFYMVREYGDEAKKASPIAMLNGVYTFACNQVVVERTEIVKRDARIVSVVIGNESLTIKKLFLIYRASP